MTASLPYQNILVIPLRHIGDTILTVPLVRNLRYALPNARIDVLLSEQNLPLLEECPYITHCVLEPKGALETVRMIQAESYDTVFILRQSVTMAAYTKLAGIPTRVGFDRQRFTPPIGYLRTGLFLTHRVAYPTADTTHHQVDSHLQLLTALDIPVGDRHLELWETPDDIGRLESLLKRFEIDPEQQTQKPLAVFHASSASKGKSIDPKHCLQTLQHLSETYQLLCTGTAADAARYKSLSDTGIPHTNLCGQTTLRETYSLFKQVKLLISVDSAPLHLAAAAGVPHIIGIYCHTNPNQWAPLNPKIHFTPLHLTHPHQLEEQLEEAIDLLLA